MLANYLTFAIRSLSKRKLYSFINISGLAIGVAVFLLIIRYVDFELSYDRHHQHGADIYRTVLTRYLNGQFRDVIPLTGYAAGPALQADIPEIKRTARVHAMFGGAVISASPKNDATALAEDRIYLADPAFLQMFTFTAASGNLKTALDRPENIVITRSVAEKHFDSDDVVGKTLRVAGG
ncbi:MAG TPA: ABC transporter permease [Chryseosolibacter sp.]|nr:ABC transporter permease [Chryseosolibacter sp.]